MQYDKDKEKKIRDNLENSYILLENIIKYNEHCKKVFELLIFWKKRGNL